MQYPYQIEVYSRDDLRQHVAVIELTSETAAREHAGHMRRRITEQSLRLEWKLLDYTQMWEGAPRLLDASPIFFRQAIVRPE